jgi:hypothetical protein
MKPFYDAKRVLAMAWLGLDEVAASGSYELARFPPNANAIGIGSRYVDDRKIRRVEC